MRMQLPNLLQLWAVPRWHFGNCAADKCGWPFAALFGARVVQRIGRRVVNPHGVRYGARPRQLQGAGQGFGCLDSPVAVCKLQRPLRGSPFFPASHPPEIPTR